MSLTKRMRSGSHLLMGLIVLTGMNSAGASEPFAILLGSDQGTEFNLFGAAVALSGDWLAVGAPLDREFRDEAGAVYMFRNDGGTWVEHSKFAGSGLEDYDSFGAAVALEGGTLVVGAPAHLQQFPDFGAAYVFRLQGTSWVEEAKFVSDRIFSTDDFGVAVDICGTTVAIGASTEWGGGSVYFYHYDGSNWVLDPKVRASQIPFALGFGFSVALSGDRFVAGAVADFEGGVQAGAAYVFRRGGSQWVQEAKLSAPFPQEKDFMGSSVAFEGGPIIVGGTGVDIHGENSGAAYVFVRSGTSWFRHTELIGSHIGWLDDFGSACAISGNLAIVGAPGDENPELHDGVGYLFRAFGPDWPQLERLLPDREAFPSRAGTSVAFDGKIAVLGTRSGPVHLFDVSDANQNVPAISQWGLAIVGLGLLIAGRIVWRRQRITPRTVTTRVGGLFPALFVVASMLGGVNVLAFEPDPELPFHPERILVKFEPGTAQLTRDTVHTSAGGKRMRAYDIVDDLELVSVPNETLSQTFRAYKADPNVAFVEYDYELVFFDTTPNDAFYDRQWDMDAIEATKAWAFRTSNVPIPEQGQDPEPFLIAVMDMGLYHQHQDLRGNVWINTLEDLDMDGLVPPLRVPLRHAGYVGTV